MNMAAVVETENTVHDFVKEIIEKNFSHFLKEFYALCNTPSKPQTLSKNEDLIRKGFMEFHRRLQEDISKIQNSGTTLLSAEETSYLKIAKENPLLALYSLNSLRVLDAERFYWAKLFYPETIDRINDPIIFFGMLENSNDFKFFFTLYPEYKNDKFLLSEDMISLCGNASGFHAYLKSVYGSISPKMESILLLNAMHKASPQQYGVQKGLRNLHFLLSNGLNLNNIDAKFGKWYSHIPWEKLGEQDAFIFEHIEHSPYRKEIIEFIKTNFLDLVYHYYLNGNFFIGNQFIAMGFPAPKIDVEAFLIQAIEQSLKQSRELNKYSVFLLMAHNIGLISDLDLKMIEEPALILADNSTISKKVKEVVPEIVKHFMGLYPEFATALPQNLNSIMRLIEQAYMIALATFYNLSIFNCEKGSVKCFRGIKLLKSSINNRLLQHIFDYGHASSFYGIFGSGYNRSVYEEVIDGPRMAWNSWSDTTCISPDINMALRFASPSLYYDAYVLSMEYREGHPVFFGNWLTEGYDESPKLPVQFEVPFISPQNIKEIFKVAEIEHSNSIVEVLYRSKSTHIELSSIQRENCDLKKIARELSTAAENLSRLLEPYHDHIHFPYRDFLKQCNSSLLSAALQQYQRLFDLPLALRKDWEEIYQHLCKIGNFSPATLRLILNYLSTDLKEVPESVSSPMVMFSSGLKLKKMDIMEHNEKNRSYNLIGGPAPALLTPSPNIGR